MAEYLRRQPDSPATIVSNYDAATFAYQLSYGYRLTAENAQAIQSSILTEKYTIPNLTIMETCPATENRATILAVDYRKEPCAPENLQTRAIDISSPIDSGTRYRISNDTLCSQYDLARFVRVDRNAYDFESLTDAEFCTTFFTRK